MILRNFRKLFQYLLKADGHILRPNRSRNEHLGHLRKLLHEFAGTLNRGLVAKKLRIIHKFKDHVSTSAQSPPPIHLMDSQRRIKLIFFICQANGIRDTL